jgi:hypothetical protein
LTSKTVRLRISPSPASVNANNVMFWPSTVYVGQPSFNAELLGDVGDEMDDLSHLLEIGMGIVGQAAVATSPVLPESGLASWQQPGCSPRGDAAGHLL